MKEPTELGTVITARMRGDSAPTRWTHSGNQIWTREIDDSWATWVALEDHALLHAGYNPPTVEPTLYSAVVIDADGEVAIRVSDETDLWQWDDGTTGFWCCLKHPVKILFPGVEF